VSESMRNHDGLWAAVVAVALVAGYVTYGIWSRCEHCQGFLPDGWTRARSCRHCGGRLG
jgi:hypothetical protein